MALSPRQRWAVLGSALALTLGLATWLGKTPEEEEAAPPPAGEKTPGPVQSGRVGQIAPATGDAAGQGGEVADLFAPHSWRPAAPPQAAAAGPAGATAPPFTYFGKLIEGRRVTVYLASAERNLAVRQGDVIEGTWRVESIGRRALVLRNLTTGAKQTIEIGRAQ